MPGTCAGPSGPIDREGPLVRLLDNALRVCAVLLMLALLASVVTGVVSRVFGRPVPWSDELAQNLLVWTGFTGLMIAARRRNHIRITVLIDRLPRRLRAAMEIALRLAVILFAVSLMRWGTPLIERNWDIDWVSLPLSVGLLYLPIPLVALVLIGQAMAEIAEIARGAARRDSDGVTLS